MPVLNTVDDVKVGSTQVDRVHLGATEVWTNEQWSYYRTITVDNTGGAAHTDWPVMVSLTSANFTFANADTNGIDLQFRAVDGETVLSYWREDYDDATDTATLWVKVPSVPADDTVDVRLYYGNAEAVDASDGSAVFTTLFEDFEQPLATTWANSSAIGNLSRYTDPIAEAVADTWKHTIFERCKVIYDAADANAARRYKAYFSARDSGGVGSIGVSFSPDGTTWTEYVSNPIITATIGVEDPYALIVDGTIHLYVENSSGGGAKIDHYTSTDAVTFTADANNPVIPGGATGEWDDGKTGTPVVWLEGSTWHMVYDGLELADDQTIGHATSSDGSTWTKNVNNPIIPVDTFAFAIISSELVKVGSTYYLHVEDGGQNVYIYSTTDAPGTWDATSFTDTGVRTKLNDGTFTENSSQSRLAARTVDEAYLADVVGSDVWRFGRFSASGVSSDIFDPSIVGIDAHSGQLVLESVTDSDGGAVVGWTEPLGITSDFAVRVRMSKVDAVSDDLYARVGVGTGDVGLVSGSAAFYTWEDGYGIIFGRATTNTTRVWKTTAATESTLGANFAGSADFTVASDYEFRYLADGSISVARDGTTLRETSDTTHLAGDKAVAITQGMNNALGAVSTWEYVLVRPFDGVDPSATVGAETTP